MRARCSTPLCLTSRCGSRILAWPVVWPEEGNDACVYGDKNECIEGAGQVFGHGDVVPNCFNLRNLGSGAQALYAFQRGNPDFEAPEGTGIRVGPGTGYKYLLFQAHYHNIDRPEVVDVSGLHFRATTQNPGRNLGIMLIGNFPYESIYAMPNQDKAIMRAEMAPRGNVFPIVPPESNANVYSCNPESVYGGKPARYSIWEQFVTKDNYETEVIPNFGIDLHVTGIHFHGHGEGETRILRNRGEGVFEAEHIDYHKQMGHGMHKKRAGDHENYSDNNLHWLAPKKMIIGDGIDVEVRFNTTMMMHDGDKHDHDHTDGGHNARDMDDEHPMAGIVIGGYATDQEMAHAYFAYSPAPVVDPTIYAFAPCRVCPAAEKFEMIDNVPSTVPNPPLPLCDEVMHAHPQKCRTSEMSYFIQRSLTGEFYYCYPNAFQTDYILKNPDICPSLGNCYGDVV